MEIYKGGDFNFRIPELINEDFCDIEFVVPHDSDRWRLIANRFILSKFSSTRRTVFEDKKGSGGVKRKAKKSVHVDDLTPHSVAAMISYANGEKLNFYGTESAIDTLKAASKFQMPHLESSCEMFLISSVNLKNACEILQVAEQYCLKQLRAFCVELCANSAFVTFRTHGFLELKQNTVMDIIKRPKVCVENAESFVLHLWMWSAYNSRRNDEQMGIENVMQPFLEFVDLSLLSKSFKVFRNKSLRDYLRGLMGKHSGKSSTYDYHDREAERESSAKFGVKFPLPFPSHFYSKIETTVLMKNECNSDRAADPPPSNVVAKFVLDRSCYLIGLSLLFWNREDGACVRKVEIGRVGGSGRAESYVWGDDNRTLFAEAAPRVTRLASVKSKVQVIQIELQAKKLMGLLENTEYFLRIDKRTAGSIGSSSNCDFPVVDMKPSSSLNGVRMKFTSERSHAFASATFLEQ